MSLCSSSPRWDKESSAGAGFAWSPGKVLRDSMPSFILFLIISFAYHMIQREKEKKGMIIY